MKENNYLNKHSMIPSIKAPLSNLDKRIQMISSELEIMKPESLLLNVDPQIDSIEVIQQIQSYYSLISKEFADIKHFENEEKELQSKLKEKKSKFESLLNPNKINNLPYTEKPSTSTTRKKKPTIDYKAKIRYLENDLNQTYQSYNHTKTNNEKLIAELNELRKQSNLGLSRVEEMTKALVKEENDYLTKKEEIESQIRESEDESNINKIKYAQDTLSANSEFLVKQIKNYDKEMTEKFAKKKHLENERKKLEEKEKKIEAKWDHERQKFYSQYADSIKEFKTFDPSSKVLEILNSEKIKEIEEMLNQIYEKTNLTNIDELVKYFIKCTKEFKNFEDFISSITLKLSQLENEVEELDFIINFCEQNLEIPNENVLMSDEIEKFNELKKTGENFVHLQYHLVNELYKNYSKQIFDLMVSFYPEWENDYQDVDFLFFTKMSLNKLQEKLKEVMNLMKQHFLTRQTTNKSSGHSDNTHNFNDTSKLDSEFANASEKIKERVRKDVEKNSDKIKQFGINRIRGIIDNIIIEKDNK